MVRSHILAGVAATLALLVNDLAAADVARIKSSSGSVHVERGGARLPAAVGTGLQASDTVVTGANGSVGITFTDSSRMAAGPDSTLVINRYAFDQATHAGVLDASLKRGTLAAVSGRLAKHSPEAVTVRTPTLILGVRGTEFLVYAE
jgi:hypothetical protein